ncbi:MAG: Gfo/Idh/MocA family oxidoreductase [Verrucomicrobiota bacterium]
MKTTTVAAGASLAAMPRLTGAFAGGDDEIKIGLVGCGGKGTRDVKQALATNGKVKLWALGDAFEDKVQKSHDILKKGKQTAERVDCTDRLFHGFDAYKKVIDSGVDVVFLVTTPGFRPEHFDYAVEKGKHSFMQKPLAVDARGCRKLLETNEIAKKKGLKVGVGFQRRHDPKYNEIIKRIQDGAVGDPVLFRAYWDGNTPWVRPREEGQTEMEYQMRNWYYFNWLCGDHILEQHIHNMDVCNWVMNDEMPGFAQGKGGCEVRKGPDYGETFDHHQVEFVYSTRWDSGAPRMYSSCRHIKNTWKQVGEYMHGTNGFAMISSGRLFDAKGEEIWRFDGGGNSEDIHKQAYLDAIRNNEEFNECDRSTLSNMTAVLGRMATYSGQPLRGDQAMAKGLDVYPYGENDWSWDKTPPVTPQENGLYKLPVPGVTKVLG